MPHDAAPGVLVDVAADAVPVLDVVSVSGVEVEAGVVLEEVVLEGVVLGE